VTIRDASIVSLIISDRPGFLIPWNLIKSLTDAYINLLKQYYEISIIHF